MLHLCNITVHKSHRSHTHYFICFSPISFLPCKAVRNNWFSLYGWVPWESEKLSDLLKENKSFENANCGRGKQVGTEGSWKYEFVKGGDREGKEDI